MTFVHFSPLNLSPGRQQLQKRKVDKSHVNDLSAAGRGLRAGSNRIGKVDKNNVTRLFRVVDYKRMTKAMSNCPPKVGKLKIKASVRTPKACQVMADCTPPPPNPMSRQSWTNNVAKRVRRPERPAKEGEQQNINITPRKKNVKTSVAELGAKSGQKSCQCKVHAKH